MEKEQEGIVIACDANMAKIKAARHSDCENCGSCPGNNAIIIDALNPLDAKPGQHVLFEIEEASMLKAAFIVYMLPLIAIFLGAFAGGWLASKLDAEVLYFQIAGGVIAFVLSVIYIRVYDRRAKRGEKMQPVIKQIIR